MLEEGLPPAGDPDPVRGSAGRNVEDESPHRVGGGLDGMEAPALGPARPRGVEAVNASSAALGSIVLPPHDVVKRVSPAALRVFVVLSALTAAGVLHSPCRASGAWSTFVRPQSYSALAASAETVWCATGEAGLVVYDRAADRFASITREPGGLASNHLSSLAFDRQGRLWVGTHDAGVSRLSPDGTWGLLNAFDGLPSLDVNAVRADGDTLW